MNWFLAPSDLELDTDSDSDISTRLEYLAPLRTSDIVLGLWSRPQFQPLSYLVSVNARLFSGEAGGWWCGVREAGVVWEEGVSASSPVIPDKYFLFLF